MQQHASLVRVALDRQRRDLAESGIHRGIPCIGPEGNSFGAYDGDVRHSEKAQQSNQVGPKADIVLRRVLVLISSHWLPCSRCFGQRHVGADLDVDAIHQGFLRQARSAGATLHFDCPVRALQRQGGLWVATTPQGEFNAPVVVNAAGAWCDELAALAGIAPCGLQPMRRTAVLIPVPRGLRADDWPLTVDISEQFYFKPDAGLLLLSPADESPCPPCDVQPEELDVAIAIDRFEQATGVEVRAIKRSWAGLRVFAPDRTPVVGFDPVAEGFFWLAGQGGYGIQTAPALGRLAAALASGRAIPDDILGQGVDPRLLAKSRFATAHDASALASVHR